MKTGKFIFIIFLYLFSGKEVAAEEYTDWEGFPPMFTMTDLIEFNGKIYGTSENGIFIYDPVTKKYTIFHKNLGLVESNVLSIAAIENEIFLGFEFDGLMRFDPENETFEPILFPEYVDRENVLNTIAVNSIFAYNDSILFIGHSKGVDRLNINSEELHTYSKLSYDIEEDTPVNEVSVFDGKIWACTPNGLAWADVDNQNLEFEGEWDSFKFASGVNTIFHYIDDEGDTTIYVGTNGAGIMIFDSVQKDTLYTDVTDSQVYDFTAALGTCIAATDEGIFKKSATMWFRNSTIENVEAIIAEGYNKLWIASSSDGLNCFIDFEHWRIPSINGPRSKTFTKIDITDDNVVWAATSDRDRFGYFQKIQDDTWVGYDAKNDSLPNPYTNATLIDSRGNVWCSTWGKGVFILDDNDTLEKDDDEIRLVDEDKEVILPIDIDPNLVVCPDIAGDKHGNIWIAGWDKGVYVIEGNLPIVEYKYHHFLFDESGETHFIRRIVTDDEGWVWLGTYTTGLIGLYVGDDPYDTSDDEIKYISDSDGRIDYRVHAIHPDHDGYVWVGTDGGLNRIEKLSGNDINFEKMNEILGLETVVVNSIEVDRFNNKWIGTDKLGLIKLNSNNEISNIYDTDNSGLFSNSILSLKYDDERDILWVGSDTGLNKFYVLKGDLKSAVQAYVYPNPFEIWGSNSRAVFTNLKQSSSVRIYDFTGDLVNELMPDETNGSGSSTVIWSGKNFKDEYVGSGVYFFTGTNNRGREFRDKMVVIRR